MSAMAKSFTMSLALIPLRFLVFAIGFVDYCFESAADWLVGARAATEYVREGNCRRCGRCCGLLGIEMPMWLASRDRLVRFVVAWHSAALNFEFQGRVGNVLAYSCSYYREEAHACGRYLLRHRLCRFFPRQRLFGHPALHDECGFGFVRRDVQARRNERAEDGKPLFDNLLQR